MAGPTIPQWQAQQGVQAGAMGQAYDRAGALFGKVLESAQGILDQKIESESVPIMESILTAENTDDLAAARASGLENKWADQAKLGAANIAQTKELKQQERDAASATAAAEMAQREYDLKVEEHNRKVRNDIALNKREWAKINNKGRSGGGAGGTSAQKEAAEFQLASYLHSSDLFMSQDKNARDTALRSYQEAVGKDALSGNISEAVLTGNVNAFMDQKERELYLTALGDYAQRAGVPPDERIAAGLREQAQKTLAPERAAALKYANVYSTEGMAALRGKENAFITQTPIEGDNWWTPWRNTSADPTVLVKTIRSVLDPEDANTLYDSIPAPTDAKQVKQAAPAIYGTLTDALIRQMSAQYPQETVSKLEQYARTEIEGKGIENLNDVTVAVAKFRQKEAQIKLNYMLSKEIEKEEKTWGVGKVPAKTVDKARALLVEGISAELGETPKELGLDKNKIDRRTHDPLRTEGLKSVISKQFEALEEEKKKTGNLDPLLDLIQGR